jgi:hypothetical protein
MSVGYVMVERDCVQRSSIEMLINNLSRHSQRGDGG